MKRLGVRSDTTEPLPQAAEVDDLQAGARQVGSPLQESAAASFDLDGDGAVIHRRRAIGTRSRNCVGLSVGSATGIDRRHLARIRALNADPSIHGILVQLPLPAHIDANKVIETISPAKDVDGFHVASAGALMIGRPGFKACTPYGCMKMLESIGMKDLRGKHAVVIGRSNIVGKPMAMMLLQANATVTITHSGTADLGAMTRQADVIVAAVGKRNVLTADMVKPGAVVIDVGMNRDDEGKLCGDVDFNGCKEVAGYITPVPGGVGPMTITMLLVNTIESAERAAAAR